MKETEIVLRKLIYEKYPKTKKEMTCWQEKLRLTELRNIYRRKLESELEQK